MDKQFISYYEKIGFAPTGIDSNKKHLLTSNRTNLYTKLGLLPQFFHGLTCLEIGPGAGDNTKDLLQRIKHHADSRERFALKRATWLVGIHDGVSLGQHGGW